MTTEMMTEQLYSRPTGVMIHLLYKSFIPIINANILNLDALFVNYNMSVLWEFICDVSIYAAIYN